MTAGPIVNCAKLGNSLNETSQPLLVKNVNTIQLNCLLTIAKTELYRSPVVNSLFFICNHVNYHTSHTRKGGIVSENFADTDFA
jgi:hypothetical protein